MSIYESSEALWNPQPRVDKKGHSLVLSACKDIKRNHFICGALLLNVVFYVVHVQK